mgnify:CR=1 FL=1
MSKIFKFRRAGDLCGEFLPDHSCSNTLECVGQQCRSGGKFGGKRWSTDRVIFNAHLTYRKRLKLNILNAPKKALVGCRNRSQGVPSSVPVVRECEGSREGGGLEVGFAPHAFSEKKRILINTRLLTCPGIVGASDRLYYRP